MRFRRSALLCAASFALAGLSGACSAASDSVGTSESNDTIHPDGDELLGSLFVRSPVGPAAARFLLKANGTPLMIDDATRLKEGDYIVTLDADPTGGSAWSGASTPSTQRASVHVTAKQTTLFNLSALRLGLDVPSPDEGDINVMPVADLRIEYANPNAGKTGPQYCITPPYDCMESYQACQGYSWGGISSCQTYTNLAGTYATQEQCSASCIRHFSNSTAAYCQPSPKPSCTAPATLLIADATSLGGPWHGGTIAVMPGSYDVHLLGVDGHANVAPGTTQTLNVGTPVVIRGNIAVKTPTRDFPNAVAAQPVIVGMNGPGRNNVSVDLAAPRNLKVVGYSDVANNGYAKLGGRTLAVTLHGGQTLSLAIGRVDMDDVSVTREDGTTVKVRGSYTVTCTDDNVRVGPFATSTGVDVLPGNYRVDLTYTTALGVQTKSYTLRL